MNNYITLGYINWDWHFAKGEYICNCLESEPMNPFDLVICGLLYHSNNKMSQDKIGNLMGFNIIDNPSEGLYRDPSEYSIFKMALNSLVEYELISLQDNIIILSPKGAIAYETRKKQKSYSENKTLWNDEFSIVEYQSELLSTIQLEQDNCPINTDWNILINQYNTIFENQHHAWICNNNLSIESLSLIKMNYYVAHIKCKIIFDLIAQEYILKTTENISEIDNILKTNRTLKNYLLDNFFSNQQKSVIYKTLYQREIETQLKTLNSTSVNFIPEQDLFSSINDEISYNNINVIFFSIPNLNEGLQDKFEQLYGHFLCVDYINGNFDQEYIEHNNVCYQQCKRLRTFDFCILGHKYYMYNYFVTEYNGINYSIPMYFLLQDDSKYSKYNLNALFDPYIEFILNKYFLKLEFAQYEINNNLANAATIGHYINLYNEVYDLIKDRNTHPKYNEFVDSIELLCNLWLNNISVQIKAIENDYYEQSADISEIKRRITEIENEIEPINQLEISQSVIQYINNLNFKINNYRSSQIARTSLYIIDTSVFMNEPLILNKFSLKSDQVVIPRAIEQELDCKAHMNRNAHKAQLQLKRKKDSQPQLITIKDNVNTNLLPAGYNRENTDNQMLATAIEYSNLEKYDEIVIVSDDTYFISNVMDSVNQNSISEKIKAINLEELLNRKSK